MNLVFIYLSDNEKYLAMTKKIKSLLILLLGVNFTMTAQLGFSHEVGLFVGGVAMKSDFGERNNFKNNFVNNGFSVGIVHYFNFAFRSSCNCYTPETYFNDHFKIRTELSYNSSNLEFFGKYASSNSITGTQLNAIKGKSEVTDVGLQFEYYPFSIRDFSSSDGNFTPYIGFGAHYSSFQNGTYSELGPLDTPISTPVKYFGATSDKGGNTWSLVSNIGARYKLNDFSDLFAEVRWQYYFSDWVDGLNPNPEIYPENKSNDWNFWFNFGYIYYLN